jgi:phosphoenolpyruvate carboxylase
VRSTHRCDLAKRYQVRSLADVDAKKQTWRNFKTLNRCVERTLRVEKIAVNYATVALPEESIRPDEFELIDELRALRAQIPDQPSLNPIVSVAFALSRWLESGRMSADELQALAGRLMDRVCIRRAQQLQRRIGYSDQQTTRDEFRQFIAAQIERAEGDIDHAFMVFQQRWQRARSGIVLTAHPTFGLSQALARRMTAIATGSAAAGNATAGYAHRPDDDISLDYEHQRAQETLRTLRDAYVDLLDDFFSVTGAAFGDAAYRLRPQLATLASWVGYDLDGRTDIT